MVVKGHYFYVLQCADNSLYAGYAVDYEQRLATHNAGKGAKYTRLIRRRPAQLLYAESFSTKSEALKQEAAFKKLNRGQKIAYLQHQAEQNLLPEMEEVIDALSKKLSRA